MLVLRVYFHLWLTGFSRISLRDPGTAQALRTGFLASVVCFSIGCIPERVGKRRGTTTVSATDGMWMCGEPVNAHEDHRGPAVVPDAFALTDERATAVAGEENAETAAARILQPT